MIRFLFNLVLALVWCMLSGSLNPWNFVVGLAVGAAVVAAAGRVRGDRPYLHGMVRLLGFGWYFVTVLVKANIDLARELLSPKPHQTPRIIRYPVGHLTDVQRVVFGNALTLTPGTLVVDVCPTGAWMYIHCMFAEDRRDQESELRELEARLLKGVFG